MAALLQRVGGVCAVVDPTRAVRISRSVRRRALTSEHQCSAVKEEEQRRAAQKHGGRTGPQCPSGVSLSDQLDGLRYEKAQASDKRLSRLVNLACSKKFREQQGKIILEGRHLISGALDAGALPHTIFFSSLERLQELPVSKLTQASLIKVKPEDVRIRSDLDAAQDLIAVFRRPEASQLLFSEKKNGKALPLTLICDNVRDPGNLGTTLRCAAAAGCHSVLLTKGCVDIWEPKVLHVAMGAHFRLPIVPGLTWTEIWSHLPDNTTVHVADNCRGTIKESEISATPQPQKKAQQYGWVSSRRSRTTHYEDDDDFHEVEKGRCRQTRPDLQTQSYHTSWATGHTAIVIGGETHGLCQEAEQLADQTGGRRLLIPMVHGVDSLNSAMAASVLLFEGRRQLMLVTE